MIRSSVFQIACTIKPQINEVAEAFVTTLKQDYVYLNDVPDAKTLFKALALWIEDYHCNYPR